MKMHPAYSDEEIRLIGIVAIEAAAIDFLIGLVLARVSGLPDQINDDFGRGTPEKVKLILKSPNAPQSLKSTVSGWEQIGHDRNVAIHGNRTFKAEDLQSENVTLAYRGPYKDNGITIDAAWLTDLTERMDKLNGELVAFLHDSEKETAPERGMA